MILDNIHSSLFSKNIQTSLSKDSEKAIAKDNQRANEKAAKKAEEHVVIAKKQLEADMEILENIKNFSPAFG